METTSLLILIPKAKLNSSNINKKLIGKSSIKKIIPENKTYNGFFPNETGAYKRKIEKYYTKPTKAPIETSREPHHGMLMLPSINEQTKPLHSGLYYDIPNNQIRSHSSAKTQ